MSASKLPNICVYVLLSIYSISSWADLVGLWVELPLMINELPEGWRLASFMAIVIQLSNVCPLLYVILSKVHSKVKDKRKAKTGRKFDTDVVLSFAIIAGEMASIFFMAFFWNYTSNVGGSERSLALLILVAVDGFCSCLTALVFLPYLARFPERYVSAYYLGNGLCGIIPGLIGFSQGVGEEPTCANVTRAGNWSLDDETRDGSKFQVVPIYPQPNFSVRVYLIIICGILLASMVSFYCLNFTRLSAYQVGHRRLKIINGDEFGIGSKMAQETTAWMEQEKVQTTENSSDESVETRQGGKLSSSEVVFLLAMVGIVNAVFYGVIPPLLPFSCLPYGVVTFNLSLRLMYIVGAVASVFSLVVSISNWKSILTVVLLGTASSIYHIVLALQSPRPILQLELTGSILVVAATATMSACFSYARVALAAKLHSHDGRKSLAWCGGMTQIGTFVGTMVAFSLINFTSLFVSQKPCAE